MAKALIEVLSDDEKAKTLGGNAKIASAETQRDIKIANAALARAMARLKAASK